ncbi:MAG: serine/threonine protein kinase [Gammaproteobacteria bacterium]
MIPAATNSLMENIDNLCPGCMTVRQHATTCNTCGDERTFDTSPQALPIRTVLNDRFLIGRVLGRPGGFGITYLAWDMALATTAAIKEYLPSCSASRKSGNITVIPNSKQDQAVYSDGLQMFLEEARTLARFSHPNITRIRDYFPANNTAYLVMEYHQGQPLNEYFKQFKPSLCEDQALEIMLPILDGLKAVHEQNFLHRDIKPQNIYLTAEDRRPILLDFGAARYAIGDKTSTLTVMLTSGFAPFEQYHRKGNQGPWTDIYACAATLYYLTTGKIPPDAIERQHHDTLVAPIRVNPRLSETFNSAILKALSIDYRQRPKSVVHFVNLLLGTAANLPQIGVTATTILNPVSMNTPVPVTQACLPTTRVAATQRTAIRPAAVQSDARSGFTKLLLGFVVLFGIMVWKPSATTATNQDSTRSEIPELTRVTEPEAVKTRPREKEAPLSYAKLPKLEPVNGTYFPEFEEKPEPPVEKPQAPAESQPAAIPVQPAQSFTRLPIPMPALQACIGATMRQACQFDSPHGRITGQCDAIPEGLLACIPNAPPRIGFPNSSRHPNRRRG